MPGLRLKSLKLIPEDMRDVATGLRAELEFSVDGMTANGGGKSVVSVPWIGKRLGVSNFILRRHRLGKTEVSAQNRGDLRRAGGHFAQTRGRLQRRGFPAGGFVGGGRLRELPAAICGRRRIRWIVPGR